MQEEILLVIQDHSELHKSFKLKLIEKFNFLINLHAEY